MARTYTAGPARARSFGFLRSDRRKVRVPECACIGCGCVDARACVDPEADFGMGAPCSWARIDRRAGLGVCSACPRARARWDRGNRELRTNRS